MKLKFTIQYGTQWGENLYVAITYKSKDGTEKVRRLPMSTDDGWHWELETSAVESRQHPVEAITYYYYVADADGVELRREWRVYRELSTLMRRRTSSCPTSGVKSPYSTTFSVKPIR